MNELDNGRAESSTQDLQSLALFFSPEGEYRSSRNQDFAYFSTRSEERSNLPQLTIGNESSLENDSAGVKAKEESTSAKTPEQVQMEKDERYLQAVRETKDMPKEEAKARLKEHFSQLHALLKGKTPEEAVAAFSEFMEKNLSMIYELTKAAIGKWGAERPKDVMKKYFDEALMGTGFTTNPSSFNVVDKHYWNRGEVQQDMGAVGYFDLCNSSGKILFRAFYGKKEGY